MKRHEWPARPKRWYALMRQHRGTGQPCGLPVVFGSRQEAIENQDPDEVVVLLKIEHLGTMRGRTVRHRVSTDRRWQSRSQWELDEA